MKSAQGKVSPEFYTKLSDDAVALSLDPTNETLRKSIFGRQILATSTELGITAKQSGDVVRSFTSEYVKAKGFDQKQVLDALSTDIQAMLNYDKNKPTFAGMDLVTANALASYLMVAGGVLLPIALVLFVVGMVMVGTEATIAAMAAGSVAEALTAVLGVARGSYGAAVLLGGGTTWAVVKGLEYLSTNIPQITKQMADNGSIVPNMQIQGIKYALEVERELKGTNAVGPYTAAQFAAIYNGLVAEGITKVKNPATNTTDDLSKETLGALVNVLFGQQIATGMPATPSKITPLLNSYLLKGNTTSPTPSSAPASASAPQAAAAPVNVKIFTGVVANGALGATVAFTERPDDLIQSVTELKDAAKNNLTAFVTSLPGMFYYEIAIVSSVKTKGGFSQQGSSVRVQTGTHKNGTPIYKTIYNKFAVMRIGIHDTNGRTVKLREIVLGPVDASSFQPSTVQLQDISNAITPELFTSDVGNISSIVTTTPVTVQPPAAPSPSPAPTPVQQAPTPSPAGGTASPTPQPAAQPQATAPAAVPPPAPTPKPVDPRVAAAKAATNLSEFYTAIGSSLPSIQQRANLYQSWGLGQASLYTGTAEQNTKMLAYLKTTI